MVEFAARAVNAIGPIFTLGSERDRARAAGSGHRPPDVGRTMMHRLRIDRRRTNSRHREDRRPFCRSGAVVVLRGSFDPFPDLLRRILGFGFRVRSLRRVGAVRRRRRRHLLRRRLVLFFDFDRRLHFCLGLLGVGLVHRVVDFRVASARSAADGSKNRHADALPLLHDDRTVETTVLKKKIRNDVSQSVYLTVN